MADERAFVAVSIGVLTVSDTRTLSTDRSGRAAVDLFEDAGHRIARREIVRDEEGAVRDVLRRWVEDPDVEVAVTTGGTGVTSRDVTPEAAAPLVTKPIPGFGELFRWLSYREIGTSTVQSRAQGMVCGDTYVFLLPGSTGAVTTALREILLPQLDSRTRPCNFVELLPRIRGGS